MAWNLGAIVAKFRVDTTGWKSGHRTVMSDVRTLGKEVTALGVALTGFATATVKEFGSFDKAIREALAVSDVTEEQFRQMSAMAEDMSVQLNKAATETARGFYYLGSAGLSATEQMESFVQVNKMARAVVVDVGEAAEGLVDVTRAFGLEFANATETADLLTKAVISSNQVFHQLRTSLKYIAPIASATNNTLADTAAVLGKMADAGIKGSKAGTAVRFALTALTKPVGELRKALRNISLEIYDVSGQMKPLLQIMDELGIALEGASEQQRNYILVTMFGKRALPGMIALYNEGATAIEAYRDELLNMAGTMDMVVKKQMAAILHQLGRLWRWTKRVARSLGETLVPNIRALVDEFIPLIQNLDAWIDTNRELVVTLMKTGTAIGGISLVLGPAIILIPFFIQSVIKLAGLLLGVVIPLAAIAVSLYSIRAAWNASFGEISLKLPKFIKELGKGLTQTVTQIMWEFSLIPKAISQAFSTQGTLNTVKYFLKLLQQVGIAARMAAAAFVFDFKEVGRLNTELAVLNADMRDLLFGPAIDGSRLVGGIFGSKEERNASYQQYLRDLKTVLGHVSDWTMDSFKLMGKNIEEQFSKDLDAMIATLKAKYPELAELINRLMSAVAGIGITPELPRTPGGATGKTSSLLRETTSEFAQAWKGATEAVIKNFDTLSNAMTDSMGGLVDDWESALTEFLQLSGSFADKLHNLMDNLFNAIYQSFIRTVAKAAAQRMFWEMFGMGFQPPGGAMGVPTSGAMGMPIPASTGPSLGMGGGSIRINNLNTGTPVTYKAASISYEDRDIIINTVTEALETSTVFRQNIRGE